MKPTSIAACALALVLGGVFPSTGLAQSHRLSDKEVRELLERIEKDAKRFRDSLEDGLEKSSMHKTWEEKEINRYVENFQKAADKLDDQFSDHNAATSLVREVLQRGAFIDEFVADRPVGPIAQNDWRTVRTRLDELASAYGVAWDWTLGGPVVSPARRMNDDDVRRLVKDIEDSADHFRRSLNETVEHSPYRDTYAEAEAQALLKALDRSTDRLRDRYDNEHEAAAVLNQVLRTAARIDEFMLTYRVDPRAEGDWAKLRAQLRDLASGYGLDMAMR
jgi:hypothetical protein